MNQKKNGGLLADKSHWDLFCFEKQCCEEVLNDAQEKQKKTTTTKNTHPTGTSASIIYANVLISFANGRQASNFLNPLNFLKCSQSTKKCSDARRDHDLWPKNIFIALCVVIIKGCYLIDHSISPLLCGLLLGWGKAMGYDPDRKSCRHMWQKLHCHRALLVVLAICCNLPSTVQSSLSSMRTVVLPWFALNLWRQVERVTKALWKQQ